MESQRKLIERVKSKADNDKLSINSQMYFISDASVFAVSDLIRQKSSVMMAWLEGEALRTKVLYEPLDVTTINKAIVKREKEAILLMLSDNTIVVVSSKDPKGLAPQIIKQAKTA